MASRFLALRNLDRYRYTLVGYMQRRTEGMTEIKKMTQVLQYASNGDICNWPTPLLDHGKRLVSEKSQLSCTHLQCMIIEVKPK